MGKNNSKLKARNGGEQQDYPNLSAAAANANQKCAKNGTHKVVEEPVVMLGIRILTTKY